MSGGVDSSYLCYVAKELMHLKLLALVGAGDEDALVELLPLVRRKTPEETMQLAGRAVLSYGAENSWKAYNKLYRK